MVRSQHVLVTGATGYIGGRLTPHLLRAGYQVRVLVRMPSRLAGRRWLNQVEVVRGDVLRAETLPPALEGVDVAYYFIHSLYAGADFHQLDVNGARSFSYAARAAGVQRIIYLSGLGNPGDRLSPHLRSRQLTGAALRESGVPVTEFRAPIVIGSGSGSFEMIRYLTERIPVMTSPRWVRSRIQPIAIRDVLDYLTAALETPDSVGKIIDIGGRDVVTYADTLRGYARVRGLLRVIVPLPVLTPGLSSHWVGWVTPVSARIARPLIEGLRNDVVVQSDTARHLFPDIQPMGYLASVEKTLADLDPAMVDTDSLDGQVALEGQPYPMVDIVQNGMYIYRICRVVDVTPAVVYSTFSSLGGNRGWLYGDWAWRLRGAADRLLGGKGFRRGRRHPHEIRVGDAVDFLRVVAVEPGRMLRLRSEARMPGRFWLQFEAHLLGDGQALLVQTIFFAPKGLLGLLYWVVFRPIHVHLFSGLIHKVAREAETSGSELYDVDLIQDGGNA